MQDLRSEIEARIRALDNEIAAKQEERKRLVMMLDLCLPGSALQPLSQLNLDGLRVHQAVAEILRHARNLGRESISAGEIYDALLQHNILSSRSSKGFKDARYPWRAFSIALGSRPKLFNVRKAGKRLDRGDMINLIPGNPFSFDNRI